MTDKTNTIEIERVNNGYIIKSFHIDEDEEGKETIREQTDVIEEKDTENETIQNLLYFIAEEFCGVSYDKYGSENLEINFSKKGGKLE